MRPVEAGGSLGEGVVQALEVALTRLADGTVGIGVARPRGVGWTAERQHLEGEVDGGWAGRDRWSSMTFVCPASGYSMSNLPTRHPRMRPSVPTVGRAA